MYYDENQTKLNRLNLDIAFASARLTTLIAAVEVGVNSNGRAIDLKTGRWLPLDKIPEGLRGASTTIKQSSEDLSKHIASFSSKIVNNVFGSIEAAQKAYDSISDKGKEVIDAGISGALAELKAGRIKILELAGISSKAASQAFDSVVESAQSAKKSVNQRIKSAAEAAKKIRKSVGRGAREVQDATAIAVGTIAKVVGCAATAGGITLASPALDVAQLGILGLALTGAIPAEKIFIIPFKTLEVFFKGIDKSIEIGNQIIEGIQKIGR
jgi:hypothetical protein